MLASHHFIPPCNLQFSTHIFADGNGKVQLESTLNARHLTVRFGHFASHTMQNIHKLWNHHEHFWTSICVENETAHHLKIGQADTDEALVLQPRQKLPYIWRSQKARLMLRCSTESAIQPGMWTLRSALLFL